MIKKILISQPKPLTEKSPYYDIEEDCEVELVFRPFIKVEEVSVKDFRHQKIELNEYTAVVFTSRTAIEHFFSLTSEMRYRVPETMKYFCLTESIALYIQKFVPYRKRKVFFGEGKIEHMESMFQKHSKEKYLIPLSDQAKDDITRYLTGLGIRNTPCVMYRTVSNNFSEEEKKNFDYDMCVFFSPSGIKALHEDFPNLKPGDVKIACFGPTTCAAVRELGLNLDLEVPNARHQSMTGALRSYLLEQE